MNNVGGKKFKKGKIDILQKPQLIFPPYVEFTTSTWLKDSHGLYDYEALDSKCETTVVKIKKSSHIYRHVTTMRIQVIDQDDALPMPIESIYICSLTFDQQQGIYKIQSSAASGIQPNEIIRKDHPHLFNNTFLALRDYCNPEGSDGYPLVPGSSVKLGRVEYLVLEIRGVETQSHKNTKFLSTKEENYQVIQELSGACKVCLCEESTEEDPLINPCKCKGSCQLIHVGCLKNWISSKVKKQVYGIVTSYNFSNFECEICKSPFPKTVQMKKGIVMQMLVIQKPEKPYMILESASGKEEEKKERNLHMVFNNEGNPIKIGRGHQCEMRVNDISVSRNHAEIRYESERFYIKDLNSKFGTLIRFKEEFDLKEALKFQHGRVSLGFKLVASDEKAETLEQIEDEIY